MQGMHGKLVAAILGLSALGLSGCEGRSSSDALAAEAGNAQAGAEGYKEAKLVEVKVFNKSGQLVGPVEMAKVVKTDAEWQKQLTPEQYQVSRGKGTERPFCGTLLDNKKEGVYACIGCMLPLFSSDSKFNSGTGWPSFFQRVAKENVTDHVDRAHRSE